MTEANESGDTKTIDFNKDGIADVSVPFLIKAALVALAMLLLFFGLMLGLSILTPAQLMAFWMEIKEIVIVGATWAGLRGSDKIGESLKTKKKLPAPS